MYIKVVFFEQKTESNNRYTGLRISTQERSYLVQGISVRHVFQSTFRVRSGDGIQLYFFPGNYLCQQRRLRNSSFLNSLVGRQVPGKFGSDKATSTTVLFVDKFLISWGAAVQQNSILCPKTVANLSWYFRARRARQRCLMASRKCGTVSLLVEISSLASLVHPVIPASLCAHRKGRPGNYSFKRYF